MISPPGILHPTTVLGNQPDTEPIQSSLQGTKGIMDDDIPPPDRSANLRVIDPAQLLVMGVLFK